MTVYVASLHRQANHYYQTKETYDFSATMTTMLSPGNGCSANSCIVVVVVVQNRF